MTTNFWNQTPLFRFLPVFIAGILAGISFNDVALVQILCLCIIPLLVLSCLYFFPKKFYTYRFRWLFGLCSFIMFYLLGWSLALINSENKYAEHFTHCRATEYIGVIDAPLNEKAKTYQTVLKITAVKEKNWKKVTGDCLALITKDSTASKLRYGDLIVFYCNPSEVTPSSNPAQFDYKRWLSFNKIYNQVYIGPEKWKLLGHHYGLWLYDFAFSLREKLLSIFRAYGISGQDYAVLSALTLGYENEIDQEIINAYSASGALHVLSVSGLHVGIIYFGLNLLLKFLDKKRKTKIFKSFIIIFFLWFYALLTGLSPSVLRSAAMLTFIVIGTMRTQPTNTYNTLAASAMFLLILNPYLIMQVGFQLSFLAVLGIIFLQPIISNWYSAPNWIMHQIWNITSVSIAAQTATFPLGLLYFHQFPVYFILSNLIIIPLTNFIILGGIILFLFSSVPIVAKILATGVGHMVHFVNSTVISIEHFPQSIIKGISISVFETWMIYFLIFSFILYLMNKEIRLGFATISLMVILFAFQIKETLQIHDQKMMVVYNVPKKSAITFIDNKECVFISDSDLANNRSMMLFNVYHHWWEQGINEEKVKYLNSPTDSCFQCNNIILRNHFIEFAGSKILHLNSLSLLNYSGDKIKIDFIILSNNLQVSLKQLVRKFEVRKIIIDSSNSPYKASKWMKEAEDLEINCYSVLQQGAFIFNVVPITQ
jgi:competence protein ComEC